MEPKRIKRGWMNLRVDKVIPETHDTKTLYLVDADEQGCAFDYQPGQYLTFRFDHLADKPLVRSYTMSSSPCQKTHIEVTVKTVPHGVVSHYLCESVMEGDILRARGPIGRFGYEPKKDLGRLVMIGAGSGVTPFLSMLREYTRNGSLDDGFPQEMVLIASYRSEEDLIGWDLLQEVRHHPKVKLIVTLSRQHHPDFRFGRIDKNLVMQVLEGDLLNRTFFLCGPEGLLVSLPPFLEERGVMPAHIKTESFF
jgi:ferredoxin-NADP reductase